jgi:hypothetical protein
LTSHVIGPTMLLEKTTAFFLVFRRHEILPLAAVLVGLALVALI